MVSNYAESKCKKYRVRRSNRRTVYSLLAAARRLSNQLWPNPVPDCGSADAFMPIFALGGCGRYNRVSFDKYIYPVRRERVRPRARHGCDAARGLTTYFGRKFFTKQLWLAPLPTVLLNALIVGSYLPLLLTDEPMAVWYCMLTVGLGELVVCYVLGLPLAKFVQKKNLFGKK